MTALLCSLLLQDPDPGSRVRDLVERLSGDAIDAREEAAAALVDLGPDAVPHLQKLADTGDVERRGRVGEILKAIAREAFLRKSWKPAARIDASWKDVPVSRIFEDLAAAVGEEFKGAAALGGTLTLDLRRATLWEALDALCAASPALTWAPDGQAIALRSARHPPCPAVTKEEFISWVDSLEYARDVDFSGVVREWVVIGVNLAWTRGLAPATIEIRATEALDGAGMNLMPRGAFQGMAVPTMPESGVRHRREQIRVNLTPGRHVGRLQGYGRLLFPRGYQDVEMSFGAAPPVQAGDTQVTLRGGTSTKASCSFQILIGGAVLRLPPADVFVVDEQGGRHGASGRGQSTSFSAGGWTMHQNYEAALPEGRKAVAIRLRLLKDVLERRIEFDFGGLPAP